VRVGKGKEIVDDGPSVDEGVTDVSTEEEEDGGLVGNVEDKSVDELAVELATPPEDTALWLMVELASELDAGELVVETVESEVDDAEESPDDVTPVDEVAVELAVSLPDDTLDVVKPPSSSVVVTVLLRLELLISELTELEETEDKSEAVLELLATELARDDVEEASVTVLEPLTVAELARLLLTEASEEDKTADELASDTVEELWVEGTVEERSELVSLMRLELCVVDELSVLIVELADAVEVAKELVALVDAWEVADAILLTSVDTTVDEEEVDVDEAEVDVNEAEVDVDVELEIEVREVEVEVEFENPPPAGVEVDVNVLTTCNTAVLDAVAGGGTAGGGHCGDRGVSARTNEFV